MLRYCKEVNGRMDWSPESPEGKERISDKKYPTQVGRGIGEGLRRVGEGLLSWSWLWLWLWLWLFAGR